jgi:hypothetical protein
VEHQQKSKFIVDIIFDAIDKDKNGKITQAEFEAAGLSALPGFETIGAEGHHYDVESGALSTSFPIALSSSLFDRVLPPSRRCA